MASNQRLDSIMRDPLRVHMELKRRGSSYTDIARAVSTKGQTISPQHVRLVVHRVTRTNQELILAEVKKILLRDPPGQ